MTRKIGVMCSVLFVCVCMCGCESLARKFVRKPKEPAKPHDVLLQPEDYAGRKPGGKELYDQYFLYWKSWQDEFTAALSGASRKRQEDTAKEALKNLTEMRGLLDEQSQQKLDVYIRRFERLQETVDSDTYGANVPGHVAEAEKLRRGIMSEFSPGRIQGHLL
jgi:hypothetical protein